MTEAQLICALEEATRRVPGGEGATVAELAQSTGMTDKRVRDLLRAGLRAGRVVRCGKIFEALNGRMVTVPSYRFLDAAAPAEG